MTKKIFWFFSLGIIISSFLFCFNVDQGKAQGKATDSSVLSNSNRAQGTTAKDIKQPYEVSFLDLAKEAVGGMGNFGLQMINSVLSLFLNLVLIFFAVSMWLLNVVLSPDVYDTVFFSPVAKAAINSAWSFVRDFFNLFFILIIVLTGISTILGVSKFQDKSTLVRVAFAAMLINFSKPITLFFIDLSQVFVNFFTKSIQDMNYAAQLGRITSIKTIFQTSQLSEQSAISIAIIVSIIMVTVMAVMIFYLAVSFIIRYIAFWVLIVLSPMAMFGIALEGTKMGGMKDEWIKSLTSWCLYGPTMLFFMWVSIILISGIADAVEFSSSAMNSPIKINEIDAGTALSGFFAKIGGMLIPYIVAIYLLFYGYDKAKSYSDGAAKEILNAGNKKISQWGEKAKGVYRAPANTLKEIGSEVGKTRAGQLAKSNNKLASWTGKMLTKKGREDLQAQNVAKAKKAFGGDGGDAVRKYNLEKAQEKLKEWKENGVDPVKLDEMFSGKDRDGNKVNVSEVDRLAATLHKSQNNQIGIDSDGNNQYTQAMKFLSAGGYSEGLKDKVKKETKKENLGAFIQHEQDAIIRENANMFVGLTPGTDDYNEALELAGIDNEFFDKHLKGNPGNIFKKQNKSLYEQEGVLKYLYERHGSKKPQARRKFGENIKNSEIERYIKEFEGATGDEGKKLLGEIE